MLDNVRSATVTFEEHAVAGFTQRNQIRRQQRGIGRMRLRYFFGHVLVSVVSDEFFATNQDFLQNITKLMEMSRLLRGFESAGRSRATCITLLNSSKVFLQSLQYFWANIWMARLTWTLLLDEDCPPSSFQCSTRCSLIFNSKFCSTFAEMLGVEVLSKAC